MFKLHGYIDENGTKRFAKWFKTLNGIAAAKVAIALTCLERGNLSKVKGVGGGVLEYKIDFGPGYRFYFGKDEERLVILISGGTKKRQDEDINRARRSIACREVQNSVAETKCLLHSDPMNSLEMSASFSKSKMRNRKIRALFSDFLRFHSLDEPVRNVVRYNRDYPYRK